MSQPCCTRNDSLSPAQVLLSAVFLVGFVILTYLYIRWVIETREGKVFTGVAAAVLGVLWLFGAFADPAARHVETVAPARVAMTAPPTGAGRFEAFSSGPGWQNSASMTVHGPAEIHSELRRVRGGVDLCTTISGQIRCTPVGR